MELAALLRDDAKWSDLRRALESKGQSPQLTLLAGFMEDEENHEFGVVVTHKRQVFEFERNTSGSTTSFTKWREVTNPDELLDTFPAVRVGLEIAIGLQRP